MNDFNFDYNSFKKLQESYPKISFISVFKTTGEGNYRGSKDWENLYDISITIDEFGIAQAQKNRFGANGTMRVIDNADNIISYNYTKLQEAEKQVENLKKTNSKKHYIFFVKDKYIVVDDLGSEKLRRDGYNSIA